MDLQSSDARVQEIRELKRGLLVEIDLYQSRRRPLRGLVSALEAGLQGLDQIELDLVPNWREKWRILETVNALALDEGAFFPLPSHAPLAEKALRELRVDIEAIDSSNSDAELGEDASHIVSDRYEIGG